MIKQIAKWGGIKHMRVMGHGRLFDANIGFAIGAVHFQRGYRGPMYTTIYETGNSHTIQGDPIKCQP